MDTSTQPPIVAGVDGEAPFAVVRFAAEEARREGRGLHLLHATGAARSDLASHRLRVEEGQRIVSAARLEAVRVLGEEIPVTTSVVVGPLEVALRDLAQRGSRLVLGRARPGPHDDPDDELASIAAHLRHPIVLVPTTWRPSDTQPLVLVGVDPALVGEQALIEGFQSARRRGARLQVLAAWWRPVGADRRTSLGLVDESRGADLLEEEIARAMEPLRARFSDVPCDVVVTHAPAASALVAAADDADLLVLGRHEPWVANGSRLGPVARTVVRQAACPVVLAAAEHHRHAGHTRGA